MIRNIKIIIIFMIFASYLAFASFSWAASNNDSMLGISIVGNKESPRVLTIVPWRQPLANGADPEVIQIWQPDLNLLDPDAYRRDIELFLNQRIVRLAPLKTEVDNQ